MPLEKAALLTHVPFLSSMDRDHHPKGRHLLGFTIGMACRSYGKIGTSRSGKGLFSTINSISTSRSSSHRCFYDAFESKKFPGPLSEKTHNGKHMAHVPLE